MTSTVVGETARVFAATAARLNESERVGTELGQGDDLNVGLQL